MNSRRAQGALEYLLLVGGAVLIAGVILGVMISAQSASQRNALRNSIIAQDASDASLVAHYNFDEGTGKIAEDSSVYRNHGTYDAIANNNLSSPAPPLPNQWEAGKSGLAMNFNGTHYAWAPEKAQLSLTQKRYTIAFWIKLNNINTSGTGSAGGVLVKGTTGSTARNYFVRRNASPGGALIFFAGDADAVPTSFSQTWPTTLAANAWEHRAVRVEPDPANPARVLLTLYRNGVVEVNQTPKSPIPDDDFKNGLYLARANSGTGTNFILHGALDDLRIYNRSLGDAEVKKLYDAFK